MADDRSNDSRHTFTHTSMRGQAVSLDFMAGVFIFTLVLVYYVILWGTFADRYYQSFGKDNADIAALSLSDALVGSPGVPENWTRAPLLVQHVGLASMPGVLDPYKVSALSAVPYANAKRMLGLDRDFYIRIETLDGMRYATYGSPAGNATAVSELSRLAMLNGTVVKVRVQLYE